MTLWMTINNQQTTDTQHSLNRLSTTSQRRTTDDGVSTINNNQYALCMASPLYSTSDEGTVIKRPPVILVLCSRKDDGHRENGIVYRVYIVYRISSTDECLSNVQRSTQHHNSEPRKTCSIASYEDGTISTVWHFLGRKRLRKCFEQFFELTRNAEKTQVTGVLQECYSLYRFDLGEFWRLLFEAFLRSSLTFPQYFLLLHFLVELIVAATSHESSTASTVHGRSVVGQQTTNNY